MGDPGEMSIPSHIPSIPKSTSDALAQLTDPYHDYNLKPTGYPDGVSTISAVMRMALRQTIACPFVLSAGDTWDFHIFTTPLHDTETYSSYVVTGNTYDTVGQATATLGTVNVLYRHYNASGSQIALTSKVLPFTYGKAERPSSSARTVSLAFELHNTTAELYKSGSLTVYRTASMSTPTHGWIKTTSEPTGVPFAAQVIANIPENLAQAVALPNSRTWRASEGAYCVSLPSPTNPYSSNMPQNFVLSMASGSAGWLRHLAPNSTTSSSFSPISTAGVFSDRFTDGNQTFTLDARQILEVVPSVSETDPFLPFAGTSPPCDELLLKLYREMYNQIPPGAPVGHNASGDWFRQIIQIAKVALPIVATALPGQAKLVAQAALPIVNGLIDKALSKQQPHVTPMAPAPIINQSQRMSIRPKTLVGSAGAGKKNKRK